MAWNTIAAGLIADADKLNENFNLVAGGSRAPRTSAGASFVTTDGAYDIGSENARWDQVYINNLDFVGSVTTQDKSLLSKITDVELSTAASSIEFTGLNGDDYTQIYIHGYFFSDVTTTAYLIINGDSAGNYGCQELYSYIFTTTALRNTSQTSIIIGRMTDMHDPTVSSYSRTVIYSKAGHERTGLCTHNDSYDFTVIRGLYQSSVIWGDTSNTITSLKIYASDESTSNFCTGTKVSIWGRK